MSGGAGVGKYIEEKVEQIVTELLQGTALELVDVEYVKEGNWYLRVFIDKEGGIEIDDCQGLSEKLAAELDKSDAITDSYMLEVSSPGLDRILKKDKDFKREMGKQVDVSFYAPWNGSKTMVARLAGYDGGNIILDEETVPMKKVAQVRLHIEF